MAGHGGIVGQLSAGEGAKSPTTLDGGGVHQYLGGKGRRICVSSRSAWSTRASSRTASSPKLHRETLSQKIKKKGGGGGGGLGGGLGAGVPVHNSKLIT